MFSNRTISGWIRQSQHSVTANDLPPELYTYFRPQITAFRLSTSSTEATTKTALAVETLTSEATAGSAALTVEHISKNVSENISHIVHVSIFEVGTTIAAITILMKVKAAKTIWRHQNRPDHESPDRTRSAQLDRENQLLAVESRRYTELRAYMEQTRHLRHDFRQHLHVIAGLTEAGQVDELKNYLHQYESELSEERPTLCANPAVDALAGHYDHEAHSLGVPVDWRLELPRQLAIPEADFCMMLGNLLENAFHASQKLPPEQRQVKVMARMLSPAMLGLLVENRYDGVLKRQQGTLHSTKHDGMGIGLVSIQTAVSRYGGSMTVETENCLFRVNILLNL